MDSKRVRNYVLTGASIGIYFGYFYTPSEQEPTIITIAGLGILITIVMMLLRLYRGEREKTLWYAGKTFLQYTILLAVLATRRYVLEFGGLPALIAMTTIMGGLIGYYWVKYEESH